MRATLAAFLLAAAPAAAAPSGSGERPPAGDRGPLAAAAREARGVLEELVRADTSNPPGNEGRAVDIGAKRLKERGIPFEVTEFAPGRKNLTARLPGSGKEKPLLLLAHTDVVGADGQDWESDPHTLVEKDGYLIGRGVLDDLSMAAVELQVFLLLHSSKARLRRDVILAWTGDEESGGLGALYLLKEKPRSIEAGLALNEGGGPVLGEDGSVRFVDLQVAEKVYQDFELTASGKTGHSSVPLEDNAIVRLSRALARAGSARFPARLLPATRAYFAARAAVEPPERARAMRDLSAASGALPEDALRVLEADPVTSALLRTTCVPTLVSGCNRVNSLPAEAKANINCRILPDESVAAVREQLTAAIGDGSIAITPVGELGSSGPTPADGDAVDAVRKTVRRFWPGAAVIPSLSLGATDSRHLRAAGIPSYGLHPVAVREEDDRRAHGIGERIPADGLRRGVEFLHALVLELAGER